MSALKFRAGRGVARRLRRDDRGAVATVFGILLAGGVLLGMLALVVDVGQLYSEREELQSGADAAALGIAKSCAADLDECTEVNRANTAKDYADENAGDRAANALTVCGSAAGVSDLSECPPAASNLTRCIGDPPSGRYIEVRTTTALPDGSTLLPPSFAQMLLGNGGYKGTTVGACARVAWGAPKAGLAVTFSRCEWDAATENGTDFPAPPPYPDAPSGLPDESYETVLRTHDPKDEDSLCPDESGPSGWDRPGGFGWLDDGSSADCNTDTYTAGPTGVMENRCTDVLDPITDSASVAKVIYIPIYKDVVGTGATAKYDIEGMAAFVPTGYFLGTGVGQHKQSWLTGKDHCSGADRCLYGYFVDVLQPGPVETGPLESLGATVVSLIG